MTDTIHPVVVAFTGGSGIRYGQRLVEVLIETGRPVHLTISPAAAQVIRHETGAQVDLDSFQPAVLWPEQGPSGEHLRYFHYQDFLAPMASGSFRTGGMVICPCSGATLSGTAHGSSRNLIERAAEVHLKESRRLILVQRETPLSLPTIDNMRAAKLAGATILPAMPGWYHDDVSVAGLIDFLVARILDQLQVDHELVDRWGEQPAWYGGPE